MFDVWIWGRINTPDWVLHLLKLGSTNSGTGIEGHQLLLPSRKNIHPCIRAWKSSTQRCATFANTVKSVFWETAEEAVKQVDVLKGQERFLFRKRELYTPVERGGTTIEVPKCQLRLSSRGMNGR